MTWNLWLSRAAHARYVSGAVQSAATMGKPARFQLDRWVITYYSLPESLHCHSLSRRVATKLGGQLSEYSVRLGVRRRLHMQSEDPNSHIPGLYGFRSNLTPTVAADSAVHLEGLGFGIM